MDGHAERALKYRQKAEVLRAMMADFRDRQTHETFKKLAADYERLASVQEMLAHLMNA